MNTDTHTHDHAHGDTSNIKLAFFLNLGFTLFEFVGGLFTGSVAILADAVHDLGDSMALGFSWWIEHFAQRGASQHFSYGHERFTLLGALINAGVLVGGSLFVLSEAIPQLWNPTEPYAPGMMALAIVGVLVNGAAVLRLRGSRGLNAEVMGWHLLEDVSGWLCWSSAWSCSLLTGMSLTRCSRLSLHSGLDTTPPATWQKPCAFCCKPFPPASI